MYLTTAEWGQMTDITAELDGASNVLLEVPPMGAGRERAADLLTAELPASLLFVSYTKSAEACLDRVDGAASLENVGVITVGDAAETAPDGVVTEAISSPNDLTGLGIKLSGLLAEWDGPVVCFDSLTSLLQYVDFETAYEFVHAVSGKVHAADARAHYYIDPEAHDPQQVAGLTSLLDARVSLGSDVAVHSRSLLE